MTSPTREDNQKETDSSYDPLFGPDVETETYEETNASVDSQWESESDEHTDDMSTPASEGEEPFVSESATEPEEVDVEVEPPLQSETETTEPQSKKSFNWRPWVSPVLFALVLLVNYLSATATGLPRTLAEVAATYPNLVEPASFTFGIWSVIYGLTILPIIVEFIPLVDRETRDVYKRKIRPFAWLWMVLNIAWVFAWTYNQILLSMVLIFAYGFTLALMTDKLSKIEQSKRKFWFLTLPMSIHFGWIIVANFANLTTMMVDFGFDGIGMMGAFWAVAALTLVMLLGLFFYRSQGTMLVMLPAFWTLIGVIAQQAPTSSYPFANTFVFVASIVLFVLGIIVVTGIELARRQKK